MKKIKGVSEDLLTRMENGPKSKLESLLDSILVSQNPFLMVPILLDYQAELQEVIELYNQYKEDNHISLHLVYHLNMLRDEIYNLFSLLTKHQSYNDWLLYADEIIGEEINFINDLNGQQ